MINKSKWTVWEPQDSQGEAKGKGPLLIATEWIVIQVTASLQLVLGSCRFSQNNSKIIFSRRGLRLKEPELRTERELLPEL